MTKDKKELKEVVKNISDLKEGEILLVNNWDFDRKQGILLLYYDDLFVDFVDIGELIGIGMPDTYVFTGDFMKNDNTPPKIIFDIHVTDEASEKLE